MDMTATERLRALLDERGVEWDYGITGPTTTRFRVNGVNGVDLTFTPMRDGLLCSTILTTEQAITATLGSCNCSNDCTSSERTGTCHDKNGFDPDTGFECTVCGAMTDGYMVTTEDTGHFTQFNFCPNCGRRVVNDG